MSTFLLATPVFQLEKMIFYRTFCCVLGFWQEVSGNPSYSKQCVVVEEDILKSVICLLKHSCI